MFFTIIIISILMFSKANNCLETPKSQYVFQLGDNANKHTCPDDILKLNNSIYLLYDVNPPEGFNLRRDVYIRLAVFVAKLRKRPGFENVRLVLPPWRRLYHWKSVHLQQENLSWSNFFDIESLRRYAPVLDFPEFLQEVSKFGFQEHPYVPVHQTLQLMHFEDMFENGVFHDKYEFLEGPKCDDHGHGSILQQTILLDNDFACVQFQGSASLLEGVLRKVLSRRSKTLVSQFAQHEPKIIAILNAEIVLHDNWGDREFWRVRRSMRFASSLTKISKEYRQTHFNSTDANELVQRPPMWELEHKYRGAVGGNYLCGHLRRGDFVHGRESTTPTLRSTAEQIKQALFALNLTTVFISSDATAFEFKNLKSYMQRAKVLRFSTESLQQKADIKDGGVAIVDQIICAHARYFIGTYESTFTYRIYEEREILGFPKSSTFNTFCKSESLINCSKNSVWPIVY